MDVSISEDNLKFISNIFNGDVSDFCIKYKTGSQIFRFFNKYFGYSDVYSWNNSYPSRWLITLNKIEDLINRNKFGDFIEIFLSLTYLKNENPDDSKEQLAQKQHKLVEGLNLKLVDDGLKIVCNKGFCELCKISFDEVLLGSGGFANCYFIKSLGVVEKRLKEEFYLSEDVVSRFKREYELTKSLSDIPGIIKVYSLDSKNLSYTMERAETDLYSYITNNHSLGFRQRMTIIFQILETMSLVHERSIIHRDLSPWNLLLFSGMFKISDFGLGKDLEVFYSHKTMFTQSCGNFYYCDPKQLVKLKDGDMLSDVFSLGKLINFILKEDPNNVCHPFRAEVEKATSSEEYQRFRNASQLCDSIKETYSLFADKSKREVVEKDALEGKINQQTYSFLLSLSPIELFGKIQDESFLSFFEKLLSSPLGTSDSIFDSLLSIYKVATAKEISLAESTTLGKLAIFILKQQTSSYALQEIAVRLANIGIAQNNSLIIRLVNNEVIGFIEPSLEEMIKKAN
jgi:serine/threonine protein kinase